MVRAAAPNKVGDLQQSRSLQTLDSAAPEHTSLHAATRELRCIDERLVIRTEEWLRCILLH